MELEDDSRMQDPMRVLVVGRGGESEEFLRTMLGRLRLSSNLEAVFLHSVADARRVMAATRVDLVVSDFFLDDGTSRELFDAVEQHSPSAERLAFALQAEPTPAPTPPSTSGWTIGADARDMKRHVERVLQVRALRRG